MAVQYVMYTYFWFSGWRHISSVVNKDLISKAKDLTLKAKDLTLKAKDSKFVLEDTSRPRTTTLHISSQCRCHTYDVAQSDSPGGSTGPEWSLMSGIVLFFSRHILRQTAVQKLELSSSDM